jgi:hypothetical protein
MAHVFRSDKMIERTGKARTGERNPPPNQVLVLVSLHLQDYGPAQAGHYVLRLQAGDGDVLRRGEWILENT